MSCGSIDPEAQISYPVSDRVNPLDSAGSHVTRARHHAASDAVASDGVFQVGDYVEVAQSGVPLFVDYPRSGTRVKKALDRGLVLNVLGVRGKYMHVQSEKNDEGYVSTDHVVPQGLLLANLPLEDSNNASE